MFISYESTSFCGAENPNFRLTFDTNLIYRDTSLTLSDGIWGESLLDSGLYIMEVKSPNSIPLWLAHIFEELKVYPSSFSKYGTAYRFCSKINTSPDIKEQEDYSEQRKLAFA